MQCLGRGSQIQNAGGRLKGLQRIASSRNIPLDSSSSCIWSQSTMVSSMENEPSLLERDGVASARLSFAVLLQTNIADSQDPFYRIQNCARE